MKSCNVSSDSHKVTKVSWDVLQRVLEGDLKGVRTSKGRGHKSTLDCTEQV